MLIEIVSDVVCPWCYIGKRRLDEALRGTYEDDAAVIWRPYQLYPQIPTAGIPRAQFLRARHGPDADVDSLQQRVPERIRAEGAEAGIEFNFGAMKTVPNTRLAHRLLGLAEAYAADGVQHQLAEVLFRYHFCEGRDVGDLETLLDAAGDVGLARGEVRDYLASDAGIDELETHLHRAVEAGITGVPCFIMAGRFTLPGAQTSEVMRQFLERARTRVAEG